MGKIRQTLDRTNFTEIIKTQREAEGKKASPVQPAPKVADNPDSASQPAAEPSPLPASDAARDKAIPAQPSEANEKTSATAKGGAAARPASPPALEKDPVPTKPSAPQDKSAGAGTKKNPASAAKPGSQPQAPVKSRAATLYFVRIDDDGVIVRQEVKRLIPLSDSPLLDSLGALLKGPNEDELRRKLVSLVPQGTKLLSAQVQGSTAILNFNEAFMYNHYGIEGYAGQLKQIVFTATAFPSVQDVQILIEGERRDFLGGEGVYIGKPLSRNSF